MRIGMILDNTFPPDQRVENEASVLVDKDFEIYLYCIAFNKNSGTENEVRNNIHITRKRFGRIVRSLAALAYSNILYHFILKRSIRKFIIHNKIDVIHVHDMQIARAVFIINQELKLPLVLDLHENRPEIMKFYPHVRTIPGKWLIKPFKWKKYEKEFIAASSRTIVVTQEAKEYYIKNFSIPPSKMIVVPNTVTRDFMEDMKVEKDILEKYSRDFMVLYIGDTGLRRGIMTTLEAIPLLKDKIPNLKMVLVGTSKDDPVIYRHIKTNKLDPWIEMEGWQDLSLFQSYILSSKVCISPLLRNIHHDTTYANKVFQYLSMGRPILVSDCTTQKNLVETNNCGLVFEAGNAKDMAEKLFYLYKNRDIRETMGENGKKFIESEFTWDRTSHEMIKYYNALREEIS